MDNLNTLINNDLVFIKNFNIDELGVFVNKDISKGTKISDDCGEEMLWKVFKSKYGYYKSNSLYVISQYEYM
jgi:hypothetical protein